MSDSDLGRSQQVQSALYRIAETASAAQDMQGFYAEIHRIVGELMDAENFYIALYDEERQLMNWPFAVDTVDDFLDPTVWEPMGTGDSRGFTGLLLRRGEPMLLSRADLDEMVRQEEVDVLGSRRSTGSASPCAPKAGSSAPWSCRATARTFTTRRRTRSS